MMTMHSGQLVFSQVMTYMPHKAFNRMVAARRAQHKVKEFSCLDQFLVLAFAQLTTRESLRDIEINLRAQSKHFYHMGLRCKTISRNTLANANRVRSWEVFADLAHHLITTACTLYADEPGRVELPSLKGATVYALDSTTIDLCLSLFNWAPFRSTKAAIKLHTLLDLRGSIPSFIHISNGKMHDSKILDILCKQGYIELAAFYVMDKAYVDCKLLYQLHTARAFFVTRTKDNMKAELIQALPVDTTICALYKKRSSVELFFKWIKQHLRIKSFYGTTENAVKTQVGVAISTYVLIATMQKRLNMKHSLYEILRVLELNMFETTPILQLLSQIHKDVKIVNNQHQLTLFQTLDH